MKLYFKIGIAFLISKLKQALSFTAKNVED